jgi:hypothetical protein
MSGHRNDARKITNIAPVYVAMRAVGIKNYRIVLHHLYPCNSKDELKAEEYKTLNEIIAAGVPVYNDKIDGNPSRATIAKQHLKPVSDETKTKISESHRQEKSYKFAHGTLSFESE